MKKILLAVLAVGVAAAQTGSAASLKAKYAALSKTQKALVIAGVALAGTVAVAGATVGVVKGVQKYQEYKASGVEAPMFGPKTIEETLQAEIAALNAILVPAGAEAVKTKTELGAKGIRQLKDGIKKLQKAIEAKAKKDKKDAKATEQA